MAIDDFKLDDDPLAAFSPDEDTPSPGISSQGLNAFQPDAAGLDAFQPADTGEQDVSMFSMLNNMAFALPGALFSGSVFSDDEKPEMASSIKALMNVRHALGNTASSIPVAASQISKVGFPNAGEDMEKLALELKDKINQTTPHVEGGFLEDTLAQGIGYTGTFGLVGLKAGLTGLAALGAAVGGQEGLEDALQHKATEEEKTMAYWLNAAVGTSEAIPITRGLDRVDELTGGVVSKGIRKYLKNAGGEIASMSVKGGLEEAMQEAFQTISANHIAANWAGYDPDRKLTDNLAAATAEGAGSGFILSMVAAAMGVNLKRQKIQEFEEALKEEGKDPSIASNIEGDFTPVRQVMGLYYLPDTEKVRKWDKELQGVAKDLHQAVEKEHGRETEHPFSEDFPEMAGENVTPTEKGDMARNKRLSRSFQSMLDNTVWTENGEQVSLRDKLGQDEQVVSYPSIFPEVLLKENLEYLAHLKNEPEANADVIQSLEGQIERKKKGLEAMRSQIASWAKVYLPDVKFILADDKMLHEINNDSNVNVRIPDGADGWAMRYNDQNGQKYAVIGLDRMVFEMLDSKEGQRNAWQILAHEFGHQITSFLFEKAPLHVQAAILNEYLRWMRKQADRNFNDAIDDLLGENRAGEVKEYGKQRKDFFEAIGETTGDKYPITPMSILSEEQRGYFYSFDEFAAETISKMMQGRSKALKQEVHDYFKEAEKALKDYYNGSKKAGIKGVGLFKSRKPVFENWVKGLSLKGKFLERLQELRTESEVHNRITAISKLKYKPGIDYERFGEGLDKFTKLMDVLFNLTQVADQNPHLKALQGHTEETRMWHRDRINFIADAQNTLVLWRQLGKESSNRLARALYEETLNEKAFSGAELVQKGFDEKTIAVYELIKKNFADVLARVEQALVDNARRTYAGRPEELSKALADIERDFKDIKNKPYFPLTRFGKFTVEVRANEDMELDGKKYKKGQMIAFMAAEGKRERAKLLKEVQSEFAGGKYAISQDKLTDTHMAFQSLPPAVLRAMKDKMQLSKDQQAIFDRILEDAHPAQSFRRHFKKRRGILGYSEDAQRAYASYMFSAAGHLGRIEHGDAMLKYIKEIEDSAKEIAKLEGGDATKRREIAEYMREHHNYIMNPVNEWAGMRSLGFFWYLGFNVKSAIVNTTQIPLVTYPYLSSRYGDVQTVQALTKATRDIVLYFTKPDSLTLEQRELLDRGMRDGWFDESLASTLAAVAEEGTLDRALPYTPSKQAVASFMRAAALPFHMAEKLNRGITALAAQQLAMAKGESASKAYYTARDAVEKSQYEYARWNRPALFRGKKSIIFLFMNYVQNTLYFALGGDKGALRHWFVLMLLAGLQGLHFAEDMLNILDWLGTNIKDKLGWKNPKVDSRLFLREVLEEMDMNPDLILHGISRKSMGLGFAAEAMGTKMPQIDMSASLSMGNILPEEIFTEGGDFERSIVTGLDRGGGAFISGSLTILQGIMDDNIQGWKRYEKFMPAFMRNVSKSVRHYEGGEKNRAGAVIAEWDPTDPADMAELAFEAVGFTPTKTSEAWEEYITKRKIGEYYVGRRKILLAQYDYAKEIKDREAVADVKAAIKKYNSQVPSYKLKISFTDMARSRRQREKVRTKVEKGQATQTMLNPLYREVEKAFNPPKDILDSFEEDL